MEAARRYLNQLENPKTADPEINTFLKTYCDHMTVAVQMQFNFQAVLDVIAKE